MNQESRVKNQESRSWIQGAIIKTLSLLFFHEELSYGTFSVFMILISINCFCFYSQYLIYNNFDLGDFCVNKKLEWSVKKDFLFERARNLIIQAQFLSRET